MADAKDQVLRLRLSSEEKAAVAARASAAGVSLSEWVRGRVLEEAQGELAGRTGSPALGGDVESSRAVGGPRPNPREGLPPQSVPASPRASEPLPPQGEKGLFWCETPLCLFRARSARPCPVHGGLTKRGFDG